MMIQALALLATSLVAENAPTAGAAVMTPTYFFASTSEGRIVVHVPRIASDPDGKIDGGELARPEDERVPDRLRGVEIQQIALVGHSVVAPSSLGFGAGDPTWHVVFEGADAAGELGLAIAGGDAAATLRAPAAVAAKSPKRDIWIEAVADLLDDQLSPLDRRSLGKKVLSPSRVAVIPGTFANKAAVLVSVFIPLRSADPDAEPKAITGLFTLGTDGSLVDMVLKPATRERALAVNGVGDIDGDGFEDALFSEGASSGWDRQLLRWEGTHATVTDLGSGGA